MSWRYYCNGILAWVLNNKIIVFLGLLSFCLFVSTLALASQRNYYWREVNELRESMTSSPMTTIQDTPSPTEAPSNNIKEEATTEETPIKETPTEETPKEEAQTEGTPKEVARVQEDTAVKNVVIGDETIRDGGEDDLNSLRKSRIFNILATPTA